MNRTLTFALALAAGLMGGLLARYIGPPVVFAQDQAPVVKEIRAQSFTLVDPSDRVLGTFAYDPQTTLPAVVPPNVRLRLSGPPPRIVLRDANGREIWSAGGSIVRSLSER
jgi:hypothetical protein